MENLMPIGEFAAVSRLSQKALRLYGANGVLPPAWVDPDGGYRYHRCGPVADSDADLASAPRRDAAHRNPAEREVADEFAERPRVLRYVKRILKEEPMYDVLTKRVDEQRYVSRKRHVLVPELDRSIIETVRELGRDGAPEPAFVLYHGPVNHEEDGPVEVCVPQPDGGERLPAGEIVFTEISGEQCRFPKILGAYDAVYRWISEHARESAGPLREIYYAGPDPEGLEQVRIAVPLA